MRPSMARPIIGVGAFMIDPDNATEALSPWPIRSLLYVPAIRVDWISKAIQAGPEGVILDLEDSIGPNEKVKAPALIPQEIEALRAGGVLPFVRPNRMAFGGVEDLHACVRPGLCGIVLPKVSVEEVARAHDVLSYCEGKAGLRHGEVCILGTPETAEGLKDAYEIAKASPRVMGLLGGVGVLEGDLAWSCGFRPTLEGREQLYLQSKVILDSQAAGARYPIAAIFGPRMDDLATIEVLLRRARELGFTGAALVHPSHVQLANRIFRPTDEEVAHYQGLIEALEDGHRRGVGAVSYKGAMVDLALLPIAQDVVSEAKRRRKA